MKHGTSKQERHGTGPRLDRRGLLRAGMATAGTALLAGGPHRAVPGETGIADWATVPGAAVRGYGTPSPFESEVARGLLQRWKNLAPAFGLSVTPLERLRGATTPNGLHYEVHHAGVPAIDPHAHALMIHGRVRTPLRLEPAALERYPMVTRAHFLECAGNGFFNATAAEPPPHSAGMLQGLVSGTRWTGIPMRVLLEEAGIEPAGTWAVAVGADAASLARSVPVEKLMDDALLALYQNGERLRPEQGYPMRLLLPGWEGNMNVKWLTSLWITDQPVHTKHEVGEYTDYLADGKVLQFSFPMGVKSLITHPSGGMRLEGSGYHEISGLAWSGLGAVARVEVSVDGGATWADADLEAPVEAKALTRFRLPWQWDGEAVTLMSRAHDDKGHVQPTRAVWKARYHPTNYNHYNAIQAWHVAAGGEVRNAFA